MCNACGNQCCGSDMFGGCGCDGCDCEECWSDDDEEGDADYSAKVVDHRDNPLSAILRDALQSCAAREPRNN